MANTEERELEDILVQKETPTRVEDKEKVTKKPAKLTGRTISSLREIIKEKRINKAYAKYNKKYQKMKQATIEASRARIEKENGADLTEGELAVDYSIAASYDRKLARLGVKVLKNEIKAIAKETAKENVAKRIKVPRFLLERMRTLVAIKEGVKEWNEERKLRKELKKETKKYIKSSLDGAFFKEDGTLQEKIDPEVIKNLSLKGGLNDTEKRLDTLKGFISLDGKTSFFAKDNADELDKEVSTNTNLPPVEPTPTVNKGEEKVNVDKLLAAFGKKKEASEIDKEEAKVEIVNDEQRLEKNEETTKQENAVDARNKEISDILAKADLINNIRATLRKTTDPMVKAGLEAKLAQEKAEFDKMVKVDSKEKKIEDAKPLEPIEVKDKENKEVVLPKSDGTKDTRPKQRDLQTEMGYVKVNKPEEMRTSQVSGPITLSITIEDRKRLEEKSKTVKAELERLKQERALLESQKEFLSGYINLYQTKTNDQLQAEEIAKGNNALTEEVLDLNSKASTINKTK